MWIEIETTKSSKFINLDKLHYIEKSEWGMTSDIASAEVYTIHYCNKNEVKFEEVFFDKEKRDNKYNFLMNILNSKL